MALIELHLYSEILRMDTELHVIYPHEHDPAPRKTLWLLHGSSGDSSVWQRHTAVEEIAGRYNIAVVMPDGIYSCFTDMYRGGRFASYVTGELPDLIRSMFPRLSPKREDNYVSGYSNGGYGAFLLGLTRPGLYDAIGAFSAANKARVFYPKDGSKRAHDMFTTFGDVIEGSIYDVEHLARRLYASGAPLPRVYQAAGERELGGDDAGEHMRGWMAALPGDPFRYEFHVYPGYGHEWPVWQGELERFLGVYLGLPEYHRERAPAGTDFVTPWNPRPAQAKSL